MRKVRLVIPGAVPRKSNSRQVVRAGSRVRVIKSKAAREYLGETKLVSPSARLGLGSKGAPLFVCGDLYYPWKTRGDLSGEMVLDFLTHANVISDDRYVVMQVWRKRFDRKFPRAVVMVVELDRWDW